MLSYLRTIFRLLPHLQQGFLRFLYPLKVLGKRFQQSLECEVNLLGNMASHQCVHNVNNKDPLHTYLCYVDPCMAYFSLQSSALLELKAEYVTVSKIKEYVTAIIYGEVSIDVSPHTTPS